MKKLLHTLGSSTLALTTFFTAATSQGAIIVSTDIIDDFFNSTDGGYTGPGNYDFFNVDGTVSPDGQADFNVSVTTSLAADGNNVTWSATAGTTTTTGLVSIVDPSFISSGGVTANNSGAVSCQTITITFLSGMIVEAQDISDFGWSSGNTAGIGWETASLEYEVAGGGYSITGADHGSYAAAHADGLDAANNAFFGTSTGTVTGVGGILTASGTTGSNNTVSTSPDGTMGIDATSLITGVRFIHCVTDVRGTSNGDTGFSATINDLQLANFEILEVPEPSSALLGLLGMSAVMLNRRHKKPAYFC